MFGCVNHHPLIYTHFRLRVATKQILRPLMENLSISWLFFGPKLLTKTLFVWWPMSSCVKSWRLESKDQGFNSSYILSFLFYWHQSFFSSFASFLKINSNNPTTMDERRQLYFFVFFMAISQVRKSKNFFHHSQTSTKAEQ